MRVTDGKCVKSEGVNLTTGVDVGHCDSDIQDQLISDEVTAVLVVVFQVAIAEILAVGCIITNSINIVVFVKMGLNDAVNISLLGLAVGDLFAQIFSFWDSVCFNPMFKDSDVPVVFTEIDYLTGCWPHTCFVRVTSYITAFITLERCLCITLPLKVKTIITPKRTRLVIVIIFLSVIVSSAPEYYVNQLVWKFYPEKNRTMLGIYFIEDRDKFEIVTMLLNNVVLQCLSFICVVVCTLILIVQLNRKTKWRQQAVKGDNSASEKDKRVIKMISFISIIFIVSNLPSCLSFIAMKSSANFHPTGANYNMFYVIWSLVYVVEGINSFVNIFVYIKMSSRYRAVFYKVFLCRDIQEQNQHCQ